MESFYWMSCRTSVAEILHAFVLEFMRVSSHLGDFTLTAVWNCKQRTYLYFLRRLYHPRMFLFQEVYFSACSKYFRKSTISYETISSNPIQSAYLATFQEGYIYIPVVPCAIRHQIIIVLGPVQRDLTPKFLFQ